MSEVVIVIGAKGFLGAELAKRFEQKGYTIQPFSSRSKNTKELYRLENPNFSECDKKASAMIYLAWSTNRSFKHQSQSADSALRALRWCKENKVKFIFVSSIAAKKVNAKSFYGQMKRRVEQSVVDLGMVALRPGTVIAKNQVGGSAMLEIFESSLGKMLITLIRPINMEFLNLEDFCQGILNIIEEPSNGNILHFEKGFTDSLQKQLDLKSGKIPLRLFSPFSFLIPSNKRDRLKTLIDLQ